jgi:hypothetical protein
MPSQAMTTIGIYAHLFAKNDSAAAVVVNEALG